MDSDTLSAFAPRAEVNSPKEQLFPRLDERTTEAQRVMWLSGMRWQLVESNLCTGVKIAGMSAGLG